MSSLTTTKLNKMKNTNNYSRKELTAIIDAYLLNAIKDSDTILAEYGDIANTDKERVNWVMADFKRVANFPHNIHKFPNQQDRFADYLMGLPGVIDIEYRNHAIIEIAVKWGSLAPNASEAKQDKIIGNWFNYIAARFISLHTKMNLADKATPKTTKSAYTRKTEDVYNIMGNYGQGWEEVTAETDRKEARATLKEYDHNEPQYPHKIIKKREKIETA